MKRTYYSRNISDFLNDPENNILGELAQNHPFALEHLQKKSWLEQIKLLKHQLEKFKAPTNQILFEYSIPRMGKRVDNILLLNGLIFVIEFKIGDNRYTTHSLDQVLDYSLDLKNFHEQSHNQRIVPILVATEAPVANNNLSIYEDKIFSPLKANRYNLISTIDLLSSHFSPAIDVSQWIESSYKPTPTIIEAAQALYQGHNVKEISRSDSGAINLEKTASTIADIIDYSKRENKKSICFITGVPGSGKTLAGLNIANERHNIDEGEHAVFLSGNGPLVEVLQEALARDEAKEKKISKSKALSKTKAFIQNIHHFRDDALQSEKVPVEKVAIFDEAQRAWTLEQTSSFMKRKKNIPNFEMSEPQFLISVLDRHKDWAVIICLIGGGQEINTGEAGLPEWFSALEKNTLIGMFIFPISLQIMNIRMEMIFLLKYKKNSCA